MKAWTKVKTSGTIPSERKRSAICCTGTKVYLFGGTDDKQKLDDLYSLNGGK